VVFRAVGVVDEVIDRPIDRFEDDFFCHSGGDDPPGLLPDRGPIPTRVLPIVAAYEEGLVDRDGPNPRRCAVRHAILTER
jgi:hypothetical protein